MKVLVLRKTLKKILIASQIKLMTTIEELWQKATKQEVKEELNDKEVEQEVDKERADNEHEAGKINLI
jgi:hypothetical protein